MLQYSVQSSRSTLIVRKVEVSVSERTPLESTDRVTEQSAREFESVHVQLLTFFNSILGGKRDYAERIAHFDGDIDIVSGTLVFTLHGLWSFLTAVGMLSDPFPNFQQALYRGALNQRLADYGATVILYRDNGKVRDNWYQLVVTCL
ncbi:hypothetical protein OLMES_5168 [Oleiphilus messinensis]|uniref:Uncharacterized protein n=1 Tax=Oleiphilus messinensis TaxID=141451 RepID=A0A1Y0IF43_9GAMM|nr:hypothetical protein [Oleiphilus messinensis]ARU59152.1 hypothetical protein OLMES_5168 [Oleiphilus messinensis]